VIPRDYVAQLKDTAVSKGCLKFAEHLPRLHSLTLKSLIGFLQCLVKSAEVTKMTGGNLAIFFAPNVIDFGKGYDLMMVQRQNQIMQDLIVDLIEKWDTSTIYPMPISFAMAEK
jgi:hypothetical protein